MTFTAEVVFTVPQGTEWEPADHRFPAVTVEWWMPPWNHDEVDDERDRPKSA